MAGAPVKILLVDDDEDDYIIARDLIYEITDRRYQLDWVTNYDGAMAAIQRREHDICLVDYRLGERTGLDLLRESKSLTARPPMILLTGQGDHEIDLEAMKAGAADYLIKGQINADKLERAIRYAIEGRRAAENLRRERDLISRIMETSPVGIVVTDQSGKITFANHRAEEVLGLKKDAIIKGTCNVLEWRPTDSDGNTLAGQPSPLGEVLESGQPVQDACHALETSNNRRVLLSTNATPLFNAGGKIDGMVVTIEDTTEQLALEGRLRQSQKMESIGQLAAGVAHDINNVLTIIQGHAGLLLNAAPSDPNAVRSLKQISAASERAANFIRRLLTFSRKQVIQKKILDLNAVLRNLEYMLSRMLGEHIALETRYGPDPRQIAADTGMIEQIVMNLAVNARDAMPKGGKLIIETSLLDIGADHVLQNPEARLGAFVCLTVKDTGCGIERKNIQRIFEPFFTTKEVGKGTGLGLATVYGIVKQHQGWVEVESEVGIGTTFKIFLPASCENITATPATAKSEIVNGGNETILVVEDEASLLELVRSALQQYHYHVLTASSGAEALRVWDEYEGRIDLLLTDIIMPGGIIGSDLAAELKKRKSALKVILTTGYSSELVGRDFGGDDTHLLPKPYQLHQVAQIIRQTLDAPAKAQAGPSNGAHSRNAARNDHELVC